MKRSLEHLYLIVCLTLLTIFSDNLAKNKPKFDLTVIGQADFNGSLSRQSIGLIDCLKEKLNINFIPIGKINISDMKDDIKQIMLDNNGGVGRVLIYEDFVHLFKEPLTTRLKHCQIKIAYSMLESTEIPLEWVNLLNSNFDAVAVPDEFLVEVYKKCGVLIPIFLMPLGIYIEELLALPKKEIANTPFVFGSTTRFHKRKNHHILVQAFFQEFGNDPNVKLVLSGGGRSNHKVYGALNRQIANLEAKNIIVEDKAHLWSDYVNLMQSFDCYVNISGGEGFSITPREALAAGIPTIISDNTAHTHICKTGYVKGVPAQIKQPFYLYFVKREVGFEYNCCVEDVQNALREVYENYQIFLNKAQEGREWVKQYCWSSLQSKYANMVKPKKIILGDQNIVTDEYLMTSCYKLFKKYKKIMKLSNKNKKQQKEQNNYILQKFNYLYNFFS